jgi:hypothetical protein
MTHRKMTHRKMTHRKMTLSKMTHKMTLTKMKLTKTTHQNDNQQNDPQQNAQSKMTLRKIAFGIVILSKRSGFKCDSYKSIFTLMMFFDHLSLIILSFVMLSVLQNDRHADNCHADFRNAVYNYTYDCSCSVSSWSIS